jgi:hypothetical protein
MFEVEMKVLVLWHILLFLPSILCVSLLLSGLLALVGSSVCSACLLFSRNEVNSLRGENGVSFNLSSHAFRVVGSNFCDTTCEIITSFNGASIFKAFSALILFYKELTNFASSLPILCSFVLILECDVYDLQQLDFCYHILLSTSAVLLYHSS